MAIDSETSGAGGFTYGYDVFSGISHIRAGINSIKTIEPIKCTGLGCNDRTKNS